MGCIAVNFAIAQLLAEKN